MMPRWCCGDSCPATTADSWCRQRSRGVRIFLSDPDLDLATVFCLKHSRTVGRDNVVQFQGRRLQILPSRARTSYARTRVEVHERMNGTLAIYHDGVRLTITTAPLEAPALRAAAVSMPSVRRHN